MPSRPVPSAPDIWYGPATPWMWRVHRSPQTVFRRWLRVVPLRLAALAVVGAAVAIPLSASGLSSAGRWALAALLLVHASVFWRFSLVKLVLRPGEILRYSALRRITVPCAEVRQVDAVRGEWRISLVLVTKDGAEFDSYLLYGSLWDLLYDFTRVCVDAQKAHVLRYRDAPTGAGVRRRFRWSPTADTLAVCAAGCALVAAVRG